MTIRNLNAYRDGAWDWGFLDECFAPTRVRPSDVDGIVERRGRFLVIEAKPNEGRMTKGQALTLDAFSREPNFQVLVIYGEPNQPVAMQHWPQPAKAADAADIKRFVSSWWQYANRTEKAA